MTSNVKGQIKVQKCSKFCHIRRPGYQRYEKLRFLLQKAHPCVHPRHLSHYAWRSVEGWARAGKKVKKSRTPIGMMSPLTQGLNRSVCDPVLFVCCFVFWANFFLWCSSRLCSRSSTFRHVYHPTQHSHLLTFSKPPPLRRWYTTFILIPSLHLWLKYLPPPDRSATDFLLDVPQIGLCSYF